MAECIIDYMFPVLQFKKISMWRVSAMLFRVEPSSCIIPSVLGMVLLYQGLDMSPNMHSQQSWVPPTSIKSYLVVASSIEKSHLLLFGKRTIIERMLIIYTFACRIPCYIYFCSL